MLSGGSRWGSQGGSQRISQTPEAQIQETFFRITRQRIIGRLELNAIQADAKLKEERRKQAASDHEISRLIAVRDTAIEIKDMVNAMFNDKDMMLEISMAVASGGMGKVESVAYTVEGEPEAQNSVEINTETDGKVPSNQDINNGPDTGPYLEGVSN